MSKFCCQATFYVSCELLGWADIYACCSCGGSIGGGVPVFHPLSLCLEVYLLRIGSFGTHPLLPQIFVGYEPGFLLYLSFSSFPRLLGDL